tara:strand:- start:33 stop:323 length:291 start_codon:yes stop_codon:yes gene_type:complete
MKKKQIGIVGPDGRERPNDIERRINEAFTEVFKGKAGGYVMNYLKSITLNSVAGPEQSDSALRHLEGGRYIIGLIDTRIKLGISQRKGEQHVTEDI